MRINDNSWTSSNPFTNLEVVAGYETWYETRSYRAACLEKVLLKRLLALFPKVHTILEDRDNWKTPEVYKMVLGEHQNT